MQLRFSIFFVNLVFLTAVLLTMLRTTPVSAFNPPVDAAGSLTVRIESPETVTDPAVPTPIRVVVENHGDARLDGAMQLRLIDGWRPTPDFPTRFSVAAHDSQSFDTSLIAPPTVYNARYPIHVVAEWNEPDPTRHASPEIQLTAHPIAIFRVQSPNPPRPATPPIAWEPYRLAPNTSVALDELPAVRVGFGTFADGRADGQNSDADRVALEPVGWFGEGVGHRGVVRRETATLDGAPRSGFASHVPWTGGAGFSIVEIPLMLPAAAPFSDGVSPHNDSIYLSFETGIQREHRGDGMTFNVRVLPWDAPEGALGEIIWTRHQTTPGVWEPGAVSLAFCSGQSIRLQLEWNPGPRHDTSFDFGCWGNLILEHDDGPGAERSPPAEPLSLGMATTIRPGARGLLDATFLVHAPDAVEFRGIPVTVLGARLDERTSVMRLRRVVMEAGKPGEVNERIAFRHTFESPTGETFDIVVTATAIPSPENAAGTDEKSPGALRIDVALENAPVPQPWRQVRLEDVSLGSWSRDVTTFYGGVGNVVQKPGPMRLGFDGHQLASSYVGLEFDAASSAENNAVATPPCVVLGTTNIPDRFEYAPPAGGNPERGILSMCHASLHTASVDRVTFFVIPCRDVWAGVARWREVCGKGKSPDADRLAGRFVFDLWGGRYGETTENLRRAFRYGLTDSVVIFHNWQRWGYDYRLPEIWPPNPDYGTEAEMRALADLCRDRDVVFAPHDNYVDIYPDAEGFSYIDEPVSSDENAHTDIPAHTGEPAHPGAVAFTESGTPHEAWFNEGRGAQSYRYRADAVDRLMRPNIEKIQSGLAPTGFFIDVWSSLGAYDYWTSAGEFVDREYTNRVWGDTFNHIRETFRENARADGVLYGSAPQISESGHDGLVGILDGAQANHLRVERPETAKGWSIWNIPHADAERTPWLDAAYHDRFILHGAGYPGRYEGGLSPAEHGIYTDDYICTEVLCGHPSMVPAAFGRDVVRKYWLTAPLARRLAGATIADVEYVDGDIHHQRVTWKTSDDKTVIVWVNRGETDWDVGSSRSWEATLPPYGFVALDSEDDFIAGIVRDPGTGLISERSEERSSDGESGTMYVNARYPVGHRTLRCEVESLVFDAANPRRFSGRIAWETDSPIPADYRLFLHVTDADAAGEGILCQPAGEHPHDVQKNTDGKKFTTAFSGELPMAVVERIAAGGAIELRGGLYRPSDGRRLTLTGTQDGGARRRWIVFGKRADAGQPGSAGVELTYTPVAAEPDRTMERLNPGKIPCDTGGLRTAYGYRLERNRFTAMITPLPAPPGFDGISFEAALPWNETLTLTAIGHDGREVKTGSFLTNDGNRQIMHLVATPEVFQFRIF